MKRSWQWSRMSLVWIVVLVSLSAPYVWAQTLGNAPQLNTAVQGQLGHSRRARSSTSSTGLATLSRRLARAALSLQGLSGTCRDEGRDDGCSRQPRSSQYQV